MGTIGVRIVSPKEGDQPFNPYAHFVLESHSQDAVGKKLFTPQLMTKGEVDTNADNRIREIEAAHEKAKKAMKL